MLVYRMCGAESVCMTSIHCAISVCENDGDHDHDHEQTWCMRIGARVVV